MDAAYDHNLLARVLLTVATAIYTIGLIVADMNRTHATNPIWTPHARFHVVWQVASYTCLGLLAWALIWTPGALYVERLYLAGGFGAIVVGCFVLALATMPLYGGANYDVNGHVPKTIRVGSGTILLDANTTVFSVLLILLISGMLAITR